MNMGSFSIIALGVDGDDSIGIGTLLEVEGLGIIIIIIGLSSSTTCWPSSPPLILVVVVVEELGITSTDSLVILDTVELLKFGEPRDR